jgi:hypothetical protein
MLNKREMDFYLINLFKTFLCLEIRPCVIFIFKTNIISRKDKMLDEKKDHACFT